MAVLRAGGPCLRQLGVRCVPPELPRPGGPPSRRCVPALTARREAALAAIRPRSGLPEDLAAEVASTRDGLLKLRQNCVLLRDEEDKDRFYPVGGWVGGQACGRPGGQGLQASTTPLAARSCAAAACHSA